MGEEPIPVSLAIRAVDMAIRDCGAVTPGDWYEIGGRIRSLWDRDGRNLYVMCSGDADRSTVAFILAAHAGFRASLEYLRRVIAFFAADFDLTQLRAESAAVAPLIAHYDAVQPGWRTE